MYYRVSNAQMYDGDKEDLFDSAADALDKVVWVLRRLTEEQGVEPTLLAVLPRMTEDGQYHIAFVVEQK